MSQNPLPPPPPPPSGRRYNTLTVVFVTIAIVLSIFLIVGLLSSDLTLPHPSGASDYTINPSISSPSPIPVRNIAVCYNMVTKHAITVDGDGFSYDINADSGKVFVEATLTIKNNGYSSFNTNPYYFCLVADNVKYDIDINTYALDSNSVDVLNGGTYNGVLVFQVPASASSCVLGYDAPFVSYNIIWTKSA